MYEAITGQGGVSNGQVSWMIRVRPWLTRLSRQVKAWKFQAELLIIDILIVYGLPWWAKGYVKLARTEVIDNICE